MGRTAMSFRGYRTGAINIRCSLDTPRHIRFGSCRIILSRTRQYILLASVREPRPPIVGALRCMRDRDDINFLGRDPIPHEYRKSFEPCSANVARILLHFHQRVTLWRLRYLDDCGFKLVSQPRCAAHAARTTHNGAEASPPLPREFPNSSKLRSRRRLAQAA